jgi:hypothetical protein
MASVDTASAEVATARRWADFFKARGWQPLPSRPDAKRPFVRYAQWWDEEAPEDLFDLHPTTNLQLMCGRRWRLLVIDLDGDEARERFRAMAPRPVPTTWATHSGGGGIHLWFTLPPDLRVPLPKAMVWRGEGEHSAIERLCDHSLIMAPPSIHPTTGRRYRFLDPAHSPRRMAMPAPCPGWILDLAPVAPPRKAIPPAPRPVAPIAVTVEHRGRYRAADVLAVIPDPVALAASWGLRIASYRRNGAGWCQCHAVGREDRTPSASISADTGRYWEPGERTISLFELGVRLGLYLDWKDAVADLGRRFGAQEMT